MQKSWRAAVLTSSVAAALAAYTVTLVSSWRPSVIVWAHEIVPIVVPLYAGAICFVAARRSHHARATWTLFGLGAFAWAAGDTGYTVIERLGIDAGSLTLADAGYLLLIPAWCAAILLHPLQPRQASEIAGAAVNAAALATAAATITAALVLQPLLANGIERPGTLVNLAYPIGDLVLLVVLVGVFVRSQLHWFSAEALLAGSMITFAVGDIWYAYLQVRNAYEVGSAVDLTWIVAFILLALATRRGLAPPADGRVRSTVGVAVRSGFGLLVAAGLALASVFSRESEILLGGAAVVGFLLLVRFALLLVENERLTRRLQANVAELRRIGAAQQEFVAASSHQLRTPLTSMQLLLDEVRVLGTQTATGRQGLAEIQSELNRLELLSQRLLTLLDGTRAAVPVRVNLRAAVRDAVRRVGPVARSRDVVIRIIENEAGLEVRAPDGAIDEILLNVLDNAVKHTPQGAEVTIHLDGTDTSVAIAIEDSGPGMDPEVLERAFNPFSRSRRSEGFGLGLAIAKRLCDASGGDIVITTIPGTGTRATITLPRTADAPPDGIRSRAPSG